MRLRNDEHQHLTNVAGAQRVMFRLALAAICVVSGWCGVEFQEQSSATYDETFYLNAAGQVFRYRDYDWFNYGGVCPLPSLLTYAPVYLAVDRPLPNNPWKPAPDDPAYISLARRCAMLMFGVPLIVTIAVWARRRFGDWLALMAAFITAFAPWQLAHGALATTDLASVLTSVWCVGALVRLSRSGRWPDVILVGVTFGLALASKLTGVFLIIPGLVVLVHSSWSLYRGRKSVTRLLLCARSIACRGLVSLTISATIFWSTWMFLSIGGSVDDNTVTRRIAEIYESNDSLEIFRRCVSPIRFREFLRFTIARPAPMLALRTQVNWTYTKVTSCELAGRRYPTWLYFPGVILLKSTPTELVLAGFGILSCAWLVGELVKSFRRRALPVIGLREVLCMSACVFLAFLIRSNRFNGQRYTLLLYPLFLLLALDLCDRLTKLSRPRFQPIARKGMMLLFGMLALMQTISAVGSRPYYLGYFPEWVGGPANGYRLLVDSSCDWGQDLPALRKVLEGLGNQRFAIDYFGRTTLEGYGISAEPISFWEEELPAMTERAERLAHAQWLVLSVTTLFEEDCWRAFRNVEPDRRAGYSILLFKLDTDQKEQAYRQGLAVHLRRYPEVALNAIRKGLPQAVVEHTLGNSPRYE